MKPTRARLAPIFMCLLLALAMALSLARAQEQEGTLETLFSPSDLKPLERLVTTA